jgi:hypothetical protein
MREHGLRSVAALESTDLDTDLKLRHVGGLLGRSWNQIEQPNERNTSRKTETIVRRRTGREDGCRLGSFITGQQDRRDGDGDGEAEEPLLRPHRSSLAR